MTTTTLPPLETMYRAFLERDSQFEGVFFTGVKTTGIFCRPTCRAKKPKPENVTFFRSTKEALDYGFRPCRVCRPMEPSPATPDWVRELTSELTGTEAAKLTDAELRERGLDPAAVRRWFKRTHGMTFHAYARQLRINRAYSTIRGESSVTESAFDSGYESLSGFSEAFKRSTGFTPSESRQRTVIAISRVPTPLGPMVAGAVGDKLCLLEFADRPMLETQLKRVRCTFEAELISGADPLFERVETELAEYFAGSRTTFTIPLEISGTPFQQAVWTVLRNIPYGETRSYSEQAEAISRPGAVRAVARANGDNRIAILVPCHRVIGNDGSLTGYGGGLWRKRYLLELEDPRLTALSL